MRYLIFAAVVVGIFTIFVTVFAASADKRQVRNLPKFLWVAICLLLPGIGGLLYLVVGRPISDSPSSGGRAGRRTQFRTTAPDDDPEFLRNLADRLNENEADPLADPNLGSTDPNDAPGSDPTTGPNDK